MPTKAGHLPGALSYEGRLDDGAEVEDVAGPTVYLSTALIRGARVIELPRVTVVVRSHTTSTKSHLDTFQAIVECPVRVCVILQAQFQAQSRTQEGCYYLVGEESL